MQNNLRVSSNQHSSSLKEGGSSSGTSSTSSKQQPTTRSSQVKGERERYIITRICKGLAYLQRKTAVKKAAVFSVIMMNIVLLLKCATQEVLHSSCGAGLIKIRIASLASTSRERRARLVSSLLLR